ncbi:hypothetical protein [Bacillus sp. 2205SS5-2]|uniref:hypothetical protein n=1 Tax=Bacillus sp. 2205SS5-2 TaxID=3109031 RepID=UPI003007B675
MAQNLLYFLSNSPEKSLMAEAWASKLSLTQWEIRSAGWGKKKSNPLVDQTLKEVNINIRDKNGHPTGMNELERATIIVYLQDSDHLETVPALPPTKTILWEINNPNLAEGSILAAYQEVCDDIAIKVKSLTGQLLLQ